MKKYLLTLVYVLLGLTSYGQSNVYDTNDDGDVNIADITHLVNRIIGKTEGKKDGVLELSLGTIGVGETKTISIGNNTGALSVNSSNPNVAKASVNGQTITILGVSDGIASITATTSKTNDFRARATSFIINVGSEEKILMGQCVIGYKPDDPTDVATNLQPYLSDASKTTMQTWTFGYYTTTEQAPQYSYQFVLIPNTSTCSGKVGKTYDSTFGTYYPFTVWDAYYPVNGTIITYNNVEYRVYSLFCTDPTKFGEEWIFSVQDEATTPTYCIKHLPSGLYVNATARTYGIENGQREGNGTNLTLNEEPSLFTVQQVEGGVKIYHNNGALGYNGGWNLNLTGNETWVLDNISDIANITTTSGTTITGSKGKWGCDNTISGGGVYGDKTGDIFVFVDSKDVEIDAKILMGQCVIGTTLTDPTDVVANLQPNLGNTSKTTMQPWTSGNFTTTEQAPQYSYQFVLIPNTSTYTGKVGKIYNSLTGESEPFVDNGSSMAMGMYPVNGTTITYNSVVYRVYSLFSTIVSKYGSEWIFSVQ